MQESSIKLAGSGPAAGAAVVKVDNAAAKRRPKSTKRKKPSDSTAPAGVVAASLHTGAAGVLAAQARIDGLTTPGAKSDSGVKLETESVGCGDDSGINMSDTWQRNGHSADFIRQSLG